MSIRMRVNRSKTGKRRSHHHLETARLSTCEHCGGMHARHHVCTHCGYYRGKQVIDVAARAEKKAAKARARQEELRQQGLASEEQPEEPQQASEQTPNQSEELGTGQASEEESKEKRS